MATETLYSSADACIIKNGGNDDSNFGAGGAYLSVGDRRESVLLLRGFIKFDLSSLSGKTITSAKLRLYDSGLNTGDNARTMRVFRVKRAWTELGITWNKYDGTNAWGTAGCDNTTSDRESTEIGSISMPQPEVEGWVEITLTTSAIQDMIDGTFTNNGFFMKMDTETDDEHAFQQREQSNPGQLVIDYVVPSSIKTINGLAKASVKTIDGLAIASAKTWNGLS